MINIYNIPVYYIGFNKNEELEKNFRDAGFKDVNHFQSINGRKLDYEKLRQDNIISIRAYNDLKYGRDSHTGISSLGTIGCTLSHLELWNKCSRKFPYIAIAEDDLDLKRFSKKDEQSISNALRNVNGCIISSTCEKGDELLSGLHFYFLTNRAALELAKNALPIEMQTDFYVGQLNGLGKIRAYPYFLGRQKPHASSTSEVCIKCIIPRNRVYYRVLQIAMLVIILILCLNLFLNRKLKTDLESCKSSRSHQ